jgi:hypothetical protein
VTPSGLGHQRQRSDPVVAGRRRPLTLKRRPPGRRPCGGARPGRGRGCRDCKSCYPKSVPLGIPGKDSTGAWRRPAQSVPVSSIASTNRSRTEKATAWKRLCGESSRQFLPSEYRTCRRTESERLERTEPEGTASVTPIGAASLSTLQAEGLKPVNPLLILIGFHRWHRTLAKCSRFSTRGRPALRC